MEVSAIFGIVALITTIICILWSDIIQLFKKEDKLGPNQRAWINDLKKYPERKTERRLGWINGEEIKACCLGQAVLTIKRIKGLPITNGTITDSGNTNVLYTLYPELGLIDSSGTFVENIQTDEGNYCDLVSMNDSKNFTWPEIAKYIEKNPENVFNRRV